MANTQTQTQTLLVEEFAISANTTRKQIEDKIKRSLPSPVSSKEVGVPFDVTLTGKIAIKSYGEDLSAYFLTKEGISIKVNASFDPSIHKANAKFSAVVKEFATTRINRVTGIEEEVQQKYAAFVG